MLNAMLFAIGGTIIYGLVLWSVLKIKRRINAKKNLKANDYTLTFL